MRNLILGGDIMIGRGVDRAIYGARGSKPWEDLLPLFRSADLRIASLECAVPPVSVLLAARIDACSLATYHALDLELSGLLETVSMLEEAGIRAVGAGRDISEASGAAVIDGIGLIAGTNHERTFVAGAARPGMSHYPLDLDAQALCRIGDSVRQARDAGAELVIFSNHWGPEQEERPPSLLRRFAQAVIDRGVDVFHGHGSLSFHGIEIYRGKPIFYDTGKLLDDTHSHSRVPDSGSFLYQARFDGPRLRSLELYPIQLFFEREAKARLAAPEARVAILERMSFLSSEMGTQFRNRGDRLSLQIPFIASETEGPLEIRGFRAA